MYILRLYTSVLVYWPALYFVSNFVRKLTNKMLKHVTKNYIIGFVFERTPSVPKYSLRSQKWMYLKLKYI